MNKNVNDQVMENIMKEFNKHMKATLAKGIVIGHKIGAKYVAEKLGTPDQWENMDRSELISLLTQGVAMNKAIQNGSLKVDTKNVDEKIVDNGVDHVE